MYFYLSGAFSELYQDVFSYNGFYVAEGLNTDTINHFYGNGSGLLAILKWFFRMPLSAFALFATAVVSLISTTKARNNLWYIALISLIAGFISIKLGGVREYNHYYILLILPLLVCILVFVRTFPKEKKLYILCLCFVLIAGNALFEFKYLFKNQLELETAQYGSQGELFHDAMSVGSWLKENTLGKDSVLVWANEPEIYFYAQKKSPTPYINFYGLAYEPNQYNMWLASFDVSKINYIITYIQPADLSLPSTYFLATTPQFRIYKIIGKYIIFKKS